MPEELKPCPFCGYPPKEPKTIGGHSSAIWLVQCSRVNFCGSTMGYNANEAIAAWNTRAPIEGGS